MDNQRKGIINMTVVVMAILLFISYPLFIRGYRIEEAALSRYAEQEVARRFGLADVTVRSAERMNGGRASAFIFRIVDGSGREYHLAAAFRKSPLSNRYQAQDMFLIENYFTSEQTGILTVQDYLNSYRFDVRGNSLQLQAASSRLSPGALGVSIMSIIICAAFLLVFNRGDQAGVYEAAEAESAAESGSRPWQP